MWFPPRTWNYGPALHSRKDPGGGLYAYPVYMCFVDLEKAYDRVPREKLWEVLREYGLRGSLLRAIRSLYSQSESCVRVLGSQSVSFLVGAGLRQRCQDQHR